LIYCKYYITDHISVNPGVSRLPDFRVGVVKDNNDYDYDDDDDINNNNNNDNDCNSSSSSNNNNNNNNNNYNKNNKVSPVLCLIVGLGRLWKKLGRKV